MADDSGQEKTEEPTQKRRSETAEKGEVAKSQELTTAIILLGGAVILNGLGPGLGAAMTTMFGYGLTMAATGPMDAQSAVGLLRETGAKVTAMLASITLSMAAVAFTVTAIQARGTFALKALEPKWERLSPAKNAKKFIGIQPWAELLKSILKTLIMALAVYWCLQASWGEILTLAQQSPMALAEIFRRYTMRLLVTGGLAYLAFAVLDYMYQVWHFEKGLKMSKQEIKEESKASEGDPMVKARMRSLGRSLARKEMFRDVPLADVLIANPTHIAIALRYDPEKHDAPIVLAMGQRKVAERIKAIARESGVPIVENKPLARALLPVAKVGHMIPPEFYIAVAEVLAFVMRQKDARGNWKGSALA